MRNIKSCLESKINQLDERSRNAIKNITASFGIKGVSIIASLLLVPMLINYVNPTQYGIWLVLSSIIGWFSFFDIGFGNGLRNRFAEAKATGNYGKAKTYVSTTYICVSTIFIIVWILFFCINFFIDWSKILNAPAQMSKELSVVALIVISFFCLQMPLKLINTVLIADQKPAKSAFFDMLGQVIALVIIFLLIQTTRGSLIYLSLVLGLCPIFVMLFSSFLFYKKDYRIYRPKVSLFDRMIVKDILNLGGKFFILQIAGIIVYQTTNIIIAQTSNLESVTQYNIAWRYFNIVTMISAIILTPFWSAFTDAYVKKEYEWMKLLYKKLAKISLGLLLIIIILLLLSPYAYSIWIGDNVKIPFVISLFTSLCVMCNTLANFQFYIINGIGKIKLQTIICVVGTIISIPLALVLGRKMGVTGVIIPNLLFNLMMFLFCSKQISLVLNEKASGVWNK